jgi:hypothetical protein
MTGDLSPIELRGTQRERSAGLSNDKHADEKKAENRQELEELFANHARLMFLLAKSEIRFFPDVCVQDYLEKHGAGQTAPPGCPTSVSLELASARLDAPALPPF